MAISGLEDGLTVMESLYCEIDLLLFLFNFIDDCILGE